MNCRSSPLRFLIFALFLIVPPLFQSCTSTGPAQLPSRTWIDASRGFHSVIGERFKVYVTADPALDPITRDVLLRTVDDWDFMIRQGEAAVPAAPPAPVSPARAPSGGGA